MAENLVQAARAYVAGMTPGALSVTFDPKRFSVDRVTCQIYVTNRSDDDSGVDITWTSVWVRPSDDKGKQA